MLPCVAPCACPAAPLGTVTIAATSPNPSLLPGSPCAGPPTLPIMHAASSGWMDGQTGEAQIEPVLSSLVDPLHSHAPVAGHEGDCSSVRPCRSSHSSKGCPCPLSSHSSEGCPCPLKCRSGIRTGWSLENAGHNAFFWCSEESSGKKKQGEAVGESSGPTSILCPLFPDSTYPSSPPACLS